MSSYLVIVLGLLVAAAPAHADKKKKKKHSPKDADTEIEMDGDKSADKAADQPDDPRPADKPAADEPPAAVTAEVIASAASVVAYGWSVRVIASPLVAPRSQVGMFGGLLADTITTTSPPVPPLMTGAKETNTSLEPVVGVGYGASDEATIGAEYAVPVADGNGAFPNAGRVLGFGGYLLSRDAKLLAVAGADVGASFAGDTTGFLHAGITLRYQAADNIVIYTGNPLPLGPFGQQLTVGLNNSAPIALDVPVGVGMQASPKLFGWIGTTLAHIKLANTANAFIFADVTPIELGAVYRASKDLDVGGYVGFHDVAAAGDAFTVGVIARYYRATPAK